MTQSVSGQPANPVFMEKTNQKEKGKPSFRLAFSMVWFPVVQFFR
jgi:hypothetical protein